MKCCVPFCGATSENYPCTVDETNFHEFPTIPSLRKSWLAKIGIKENYLPQSAVVCSQHFTRDDFYWAGNGKRKFKKTAIPSILPVSNSESPTFEFCLICLDPDTSKLFLLDNNHLARAYTTLTGLAINVLRDHINTVPKLCPECAQRLTNCDVFKDKTMRAHFIMIKLLQKDKTITTRGLKSVDRVGNVLTSNIVKHAFTPNHCDLYLVHNDEDDNKNTKQEKNIICELEDNIDGKSEKSDETVYESDKDANNFEIHSEDDDHKHTKQEENIIYELDDNIYGKNEKSDENKYECDEDADDYEIHNKDIKQDEKIIYKLQDNMDGTSEKSDKTMCESYEDANDYDYYNEINHDVNCDSTYEAEFLNSDSDHSLKCEGDDEMDFDIDISDHIDEYLNENCRGDILLKALKVGSQSENRVSLNNVIFVKDPKPIIQHKDAIPRTDNDHPIQNNRKNNDTKCKSKTNEQAINKPSVSINIANGEIVIKPTKRTNLKNKTKVISDTQLMKTKFLIINSPKRRVAATKTVPMTKKRTRARQLPADKYIPRPKTQDCRKMGLKSFTRTWLTHEEQLSEMQKRRDSNEYKSSVYKCEMCYKVFCTPATHKAHMDKHTHKYGKLECDICGLHFKTRPDLTRHLLVHGNIYNCKLCSFNTHSRTIAMNHQRFHDGKTYKCRLCDAEFRKPTSYCSHMRIKHPSDYACALCGYSFVSPAGVRVHIKLKHPFDDVKMCKHTGERLFKCEICHKQFIYNVSYKAHVLRHSNKTRYTCGVCLKTFSSVSNRTKHMRSHLTSRPMYKCKLCNKSYTEPAGLDQHRSHVHLKVPWPKRNRCDRHRTKTKRPRLESDSRDTVEP